MEKFRYELRTKQQSLDYYSDDLNNIFRHIKENKLNVNKYDIVRVEVKETIWNAYIEDFR